MRAEIRKPASLDELPDFCSLEEVSKVFQVSCATAYRMVEQGNIPCLRIGRRVIVSKEHLKLWVGRSIDMGSEQHGTT